MLVARKWSTSTCPMHRHCGLTFTLHPADTLAGEISSQSRQASGIRIRRPERSLRRQRSRWTDAANCSQRRMQGRWLPVLGWAARLTSNYKELPGGSEGKASVCNAGDLGSIPELGRALGEGNGNPLQYSGLENSMDRRAWWATAHWVAKSWTQL